MTVATIAKEIPLTPEQATPIYVVAVCLFVVSWFVFQKVLGKIRARGGLVRSDFFRLPDVVVVAIFIVLFLLALAAEWLLPSSGVGPAGLQFMLFVLVLALPVILALLVVRGLSLPEVFGLRRVGLFRSVVIAVGLVLLLLPLLSLVTTLSAYFLDGRVEQQEVVKTFREATKAGKRGVMWSVVIQAAIVLPIVEELLFRGYFYPVMKRIAGPVPAALGISLLFGAVHNNAAGFLVLTVLALGLTIAYEWSGSILVPIFMHQCFNATMLTLMWWQTVNGVTP